VAHDIDPSALDSWITGDFGADLDLDIDPDAPERCYGCGEPIDVDDCSYCSGCTGARWPACTRIVLTEAGERAADAILEATR
jgi:DNA primase catalytic subunit